MMISLLLAAAVATSAPPVGLRVEVQSLGRGQTGTVVGVAIQVAPEDRARVGAAVRLALTLIRAGRPADRGEMAVQLSGDGSTLVYREWPAGEGELRVRLESLDGKAGGAWSGKVIVTQEMQPFEPPKGASADAVALSATAPSSTAVRFLPPPRSSGIGALQLEVDAPSATARVQFFQDEKELVTRQRAPWTVSVELGAVAQRVTVRAVAFAENGAFLGEDALVINGRAGQIEVQVLVGPEAGAERTVTVAVSPKTGLEEVILHADDKALARWTTCPCVTTVPVATLGNTRILAAEAHGDEGARGEAVLDLKRGPFTAEVLVEQVELPVVVTDAAGKLVDDLAKADFKVLEDGAEVPIDTFATTSDLPLKLGIAVDISGSMKPTFPQVRAALGAFLTQVLRPGDRVFLQLFAFEDKIVVDWTSDPRPIVDALAKVEPQGGTSLHDAVVRGLEYLRGERGRTALVLLSDGDDTTSRTGWDVALRYARTVRTPVFTIGFGIGVLDFFVRDHLKTLAADTGGEVLYVPRKGDLTSAYKRIGDQLHSEYILSYRSPSKKARDAFRAVAVQVRRPGLVARTITGYFPSM